MREPQHRARRRPAADRRPPRGAADAAWRSTRKLTQLADELTHQYKVTYARPQSLIPPEQVTVAAPSRASPRAARSIKEDKGRAVKQFVLLPSSRRVAVAAPRLPRRRGVARAGRDGRAAAAGAVPRRRRPRLAERHRHRRRRQATSPTSTAEDFNVFEDGVKQDVTFFNRTNLPIALALLLDTSASMDTKLPTAQEAAIGFAKRLRPQDLAEVIDFDSRVVVLQNFTNSAAELEPAIKKTSAGGSTSLYNAVYIALKDLKKVVAKNTEEIRRQAIVVLSDGEDTSSLLPFEEVLDLAKRSETAIYCDRPARARRSRHDDQGVQGSGVRAAAVRAGDRRRASFFPNQLAELAGVYGQISDELSSQYTVGYTSRNPKRDGSWRRVVVRVDAPEHDGAHQAGYFAPTARS